LSVFDGIYAAPVATVNQLLSKHNMTVKSLIGAQGEVFRLEPPVAVNAGQRLFYGIHRDGTPIVRVSGDTPIFDDIADALLRPAADVIGIAASPEVTEAKAPTVSWWMPEDGSHRPAPSRLGLSLNDADPELCHLFDVTAEFLGHSTRSDQPPAATISSAPTDFSGYLYPPAAASRELLIPLPRRG
jgi:hypothetical protein